MNNHQINEILDARKAATDYDIGTRDLIPPELMALLPTFAQTREDEDPVCILKLIDPATGSEWLVASAQKYGDDTLLFTHVTLGGDTDNAEWGEISYREINDMNRVGGTRLPWPGRVEVDVSFEPRRFSVINDDGDDGDAVEAAAQAWIAGDET